MTQKSETLPLILALLVTLGLIGAAAWWLTRGSSGLGNRTTQQVEAPRDRAIATLARVENVPSGLFNYGGSTTWAPLRTEVDSAVQTVWPQFQLRYTQPTSGAPGSGTGIKMLLDGQLSFAQSSRPLKTEEYQAAQAKGFSLQEIPVAIDGIAIAVHPSLPVPGLSISQLRDIYTGKISNWSQVNGPNLPITAYSRRPEAGGTVEFFLESLLEGEALAPTVQLIGTTTEALRKVAATPGSIYYASAPEVVPQCTVKTLPLGRAEREWVAPYQTPFVPLERCPQQRNVLNASAFQSSEYPITRRLFVIVKQNGQADEQAGKAYAKLLLTDQGQAAIEKAGFVPLR